MLIVFHLIIALLILYTLGLGVVGFFNFSVADEFLRRRIKYIIPIIGYCSSLIVYWLSYASIGSAKPAFYATIFILLSIDVIFLWKIKNRSETQKNYIGLYLPRAEDFQIIFVLALIFMIANWQYIIIGEMNYYHSGNEDFFDNILGGQAYLTFPYNHISVDYISDFRLTYSSQAFWRIMLSVNGMDAFMLQSILNILMTSLGVYWLVLSVFKGGKNIALFSAFWSVAANFYLTTFLNGHIGSMMYGSVAPIFIGLFVLLIRNELKPVWLILLLLIFLFTHYTYPGPIYFLLVPLIVLLLHAKLFERFNIYFKIRRFLNLNITNNLLKDIKKVRWFRIFIMFILILFAIILLTNFTYAFFESRRIQALLRTNVSWKISLFKEMFMIFWGIYPSGSTGTLSILPLFISNEVMNNLSLIIALLLTVVVFAGGFASRFDKNRQFLFLYTIFFIPFLIIMRYFWGSPYYFYKFLYVNYFLVIIILFFFINSVLVKVKSKNGKYFTIASFALLGTLNILWNIAIGADYFTRPYNNKSKVNNFIDHVDKKLLADAALDIPNWINDMVFAYIFNEKGIKLKSNNEKPKYLIQLLNYGSVFHNSISPTEEIFNNHLLRIVKKPDSNSAAINTQYEPEFRGAANINWIGNDISYKNEVIRSSMNGLMDYLESSKNKNIYFFDIVDKDIYALIDKNLHIRNIKLNYDSSWKSTFVQLKTGESFFNIDGEEKIIWENDIFRLMTISKIESYKTKALKERIDFSGLLETIKREGNKVFLNFQDIEPVKLYLKEYLSSNGINVCDVPDSSDLICRYKFFDPLFSSYFEQESDISSKVLWTSFTLNIIKRAWEVELVKNKARFSIGFKNEQVSDLPVSVLLNQSKGDFDLSITNPSRDARFLRLLISSGPSIDFKDFQLDIRMGDQTISRKIGAQVSLIDVPLIYPINSSKNIFVSLSARNSIGKSLLPLDDRFLIYQIHAAELTNQIDYYSDYMLLAMRNNMYQGETNRIFNFLGKSKNSPDIISKDESNILNLGLGWMQYEVYEGEGFRWTGTDPVELVVKREQFPRKILKFDMETGPGCGSKPLHMDVLFNNFKIDEKSCLGINSIKIDLGKIPHDIVKNQNIIKLIATTDNLKNLADERILNFRTYKISLEESQTEDIANTFLLNNMRLSRGWYPYEKFNNENFRWIGKEPADLILDTEFARGKKFNLQLEPGPSCVGTPLRLSIYLNNKPLQKYNVTGKQNIEVTIPENLPAGMGKEINLSIRSENENVKIPTDQRILKFRVFNISLNEKKEPDIIAPEKQNFIKISNGWYPLEIYQNKAFRWVGKSTAVFSVNKSGLLKEIFLDLEPGPGSGGKELPIDIVNGNKIVKKINITKRETISFDLKMESLNKKEEWLSVKLVPHSENKRIKEDQRILNFRVFSISGR